MEVRFREPVTISSNSTNMWIKLKPTSSPFRRSTPKPQFKSRRRWLRNLSLIELNQTISTFSFLIPISTPVLLCAKTLKCLTQQTSQSRVVIASCALPATSSLIQTKRTSFTCSVHLKAGCSGAYKNSRDCQTLSQQGEALAKWMSEREKKKSSTL